MWTAIALWILTCGGAAIYIAWATQLAARGTPVWVLAIGALALYLALILVFTATYFGVAWIYRARRPREAQIGVAATLSLFANEYLALAGSARRMMFYKLLVRDPPSSSPAATPVLLLHGVLCNAGVWLRLSRVLAAARISPVYTMSYGPPLASIELFADQLAAKIDAILAATGARSVVVVSHSMGGLVALAYCRRFGAAKIRRLISLGAPYHGSIHARFCPGVCLAQIRPASRWLDLLHATLFALPPVFSIWSWHDSMVAPQTSAELADAENITLVGVGHNALLADRDAAAQVVALIRQAQDESAVTSGSPASVARTPSPPA
jgi:pimeloyl-ACP methyl ester carboxylesterase